MSRTHHKRIERARHESTRQSSRPKLTKHWTLYMRSIFDYNEGHGSTGFELWRSSFNGYQKERKRRRVRKIMKRHGRRMARYEGRREARLLKLVDEEKRRANGR